MAILSPSILAANAMNLQRDLTETAQHGVKWLHIDIMDGLFVPNLSFGYSTVKGIRGFSEPVRTPAWESVLLCLQALSHLKILRIATSLRTW